MTAAGTIVPIEIASSLSPEGYGTNLVTLAGNSDGLSVPIDVGEGDGRNLAQAETTVQQKAQDGRIAPIGEPGPRGSLEQGTELVWAKDFHWLLDDLGWTDLGHWVDLNLRLLPRPHKELP